LEKTEHSEFDDCSQAYLPKMDKENGILISLNVQCSKENTGIIKHECVERRRIDRGLYD